MKSKILIIIFSIIIFTKSYAEESTSMILNKTNFMHASTKVKEEKKAYKEITAYLIKSGKYNNFQLADKDANERVEHFKNLGLYSNDPGLKNASIYKRKIHALIYAHKLHNVIVNNKGYLPSLEK